MLHRESQFRSLATQGVTRASSGNDFVHPIWLLRDTERQGLPLLRPLLQLFSVLLFLPLIIF